MVWLRGWHPSPLYCFPSHADFEALFEAAVLALIAVVLVNGTVPIGTACVTQVSPYTPFKEAFATLAGELAIVFATRLVPANHALDVRRLLFFHRLALLVRLV